MRQSRIAWWSAGLVVGYAGLGVSLLLAAALSIRETPLVAVGEAIIEITPGGLAERAISAVGRLDKPLLVTGVVAVLTLLFALAGSWARRGLTRPFVLYVVLAGVAGLAVVTRSGTGTVDLVPVLGGTLVWLAGLAWVSTALRDTVDPDDDDGLSRRRFLTRAGALAALAVGAGLASRVVGRGQRHVSEVRRLLRIPGVTEPEPPRGVAVDLEDITPWQTPNADFYRIDTALVVPSIDPGDWQLRIHGMVDRPMTLTYQQLLDRRRSQAWITLNCVSNEVGGDLIGNAWWSGLLVRELLTEVGVDPDADAVLQTSHDGWTCGTPLAALTDARNAMLAVAMNGEPLPLEHGFPVRMIVPGLYGFVSATKWVVDLEVTRFDRFTAYWTDRGWAAQAPCKIASRIDVPRADAEVVAGQVRVGGVAWHQHVGISGVQVQLDGSAWQDADLAHAANIDTWVQWSTTLTVAAGEHRLRVRAIDADGELQTGVEADVVPDGATGWHQVAFTAADA